MARKQIVRAAEFGGKLGAAAGWNVVGRVRGRPEIRTRHYAEIDDDGGPEYVRALVEPGVVEPEFGYVVSARGQLLADSMQPNGSQVHHHRPWRIGTPSFFTLAPRLVRSRPVERFERVISLRHFWEWNYYHFYFDVLGKLGLIEAAVGDPDTPIVLGDYVDELSFVRQIIGTGALRERHWIVPHGRSVAADEIIYCRTRQSHRTRIDFVLDQMGVDSAAERRNDRIFVGRQDAPNRRLLNQAQLVPIFREYGFEIVEGLGGLSIAEQIDLFANARHVVAIHGAGLANVFFRRDRPLSLLELHADGFISNDFARASGEFPWAYGRLPGPAAGSDLPRADFTVDPGELSRALQRMLDEDLVEAAEAD